MPPTSAAIGTPTLASTPVRAPWLPPSTITTTAAVLAPAVTPRIRAPDPAAHCAQARSQCHQLPAADERDEERRSDQAEHDPDLQLPRPHHDPADDSVVSSSTAPANPEAGSNHRWSGPVKNRATCGTTSPTNPIGPQAATPRR
jgi:hypothetical protein